MSFADFENRACGVRCDCAVKPPAQVLRNVGGMRLIGQCYGPVQVETSCRSSRTRGRAVTRRRMSALPTQSTSFLVSVQLFHTSRMPNAVELHGGGHVRSPIGCFARTRRQSYTRMVTHIQRNLQTLAGVDLFLANMRRRPRLSRLLIGSATRIPGGRHPMTKDHNSRPGNDTFEQAWRSRFEEFASLRDDDAGIAGWSSAGLDARVASIRGTLAAGATGNALARCRLRCGDLHAVPDGAGYRLDGHRLFAPRHPEGENAQPAGDWIRRGRRAAVAVQGRSLRRHTLFRRDSSVG